MTRAESDPPNTRDLNQVLLAVRQAADVLCDRWTLLILLYTFSGIRRSSQLSALTGIASRQLKKRLDKLETLEIIVRMPYSRRPLRYENHLTLMGQALFDIFACMITWESKFSATNTSIVARVTRLDGTPDFLSTELICAHCNTAVSARDVVGRSTKGANKEPLPIKRSTYRRSKNGSDPEIANDTPLPEAIRILGDKWTIELLVIALSRIGNFLEIQSLTGIATNILSDRLSRLVDLGLLKQSSSGAHDRKGTYRITEKGIGFYSVLIAIQDWADFWLPERQRSPMTLIHRPCNRVLALQLRCKKSNQDIGIHNATIFIDGKTDQV